MFCLGHHISTLVSAERSSFLCGLCCPLLNDLFFTLRTPLHYGFFLNNGNHYFVAGPC